MQLHTFVPDSSRAPDLLHDLAGRLIVLEGPDGCGKSTQQALLVERLRREGIDAATFAFPRREGPVGALIDAYLRGDLGAKDDLPLEVPSLLYSLDRYSARAALREALARGTTLVLSRYWQSNVAFQAAKVAGAGRRAAYAWLCALDARMPAPDLVVLLDAPVEALRRRTHARAGGPDQHETDLAYQREVRRVYRQLARKHGWPVVDARETLEAVQAAVWAAVIGRFGASHLPPEGGSPLAFYSVVEGRDLDGSDS